MVRKQIKLADIARELNVSVGLVSLVLSGKAKDNRISDALAEKVVTKARELGYKTNQMARGLRTGRSGIIGIVVADIANPYFGKMARSIENEASKMGYHVMFGSSDEDAGKLKDLINIFLSRQVDAMAIVPVRNSQEYLMELTHEPTPIVYIDRYCDGVTEDVCCADNFKGGFAIANHLIERGYVRIGAFVSDRILSTNIDRIEGFEEALHRAGKSVEERLLITIEDSNLDDDLQPALERLIQDGCDAIFFANNNIAIKSLSLLDQLGVVVPDDLAIASFDNPEAFAVTKPRITCYEQPIEEICATAVQTIIDKLENDHDHEISRRMFEGELIVRNSC